MQNKANDKYSLAHTSWKCQYHIVFVPKYRRKAIYGKLKAEIGAILRELCERKHVNIIFERFSNLKYKYGNRHFWCRGYYVSTVGGNKQGIARYIREEEHEDQIYDQLTMKEYDDPFKE